MSGTDEDGSPVAERKGTNVSTMRRNQSRGRGMLHHKEDAVAPAAVNMEVVQQANLRRQYIIENRAMEAAKRRMKEIERDVAALRKEERGLGVKKYKARKNKLDAHVAKMAALVEEENKDRIQSEKDVAVLTEEVAIFSAKYEDICQEVNNLLAIKSQLEREIDRRTKEFDVLIAEQNERQKSVEGELVKMESVLSKDNGLRNAISAEKGTVEETLDKLKDLLAKEEENIESDKEQLLKRLKAIKMVMPAHDFRKRLSSFHAPVGGSNANFARGSVRDAMKSTTRPNQNRGKRYSIMQTREALSERITSRETVVRNSGIFDGSPLTQAQLKEAEMAAGSSKLG